MTRADGNAATPTSGIAALVIGVVALLIALVAGGLGFIPAVISLICAYTARRQAQTSVVTAALVIGWIAVVLALIRAATQVSSY